MDEESIFAEALEKPDPAERAAFLDRVCAGSPTLRNSVEALLGDWGNARCGSTSK